MFGVPIIGPARVRCDNQGVVKNTSIPSSALTKRHNAINYHAVREATGAGIICVGKEDGHSNLADALTKPLGHQQRYDLFSKITYSSMFPANWPQRRPSLLDRHRVAGAVQFIPQHKGAQETMFTHTCTTSYSIPLHFNKAIAAYTVTLIISSQQL